MKREGLEEGEEIERTVAGELADAGSGLPCVKEEKVRADAADDFPDGCLDALEVVGGNANADMLLGICFWGEGR